MVVYFGENDPRNISRRIVGKNSNVAELTAVIETFNVIKDDLLDGEKYV